MGFSYSPSIILRKDYLFIGTTHENAISVAMVSHQTFFLLCFRAYKSCGQGGPPHVKIVVEWDKETKD